MLPNRKFTDTTVSINKRVEMVVRRRILYSSVFDLSVRVIVAKGTRQEVDLTLGEEREIKAVFGTHFQRTTKKTWKQKDKFQTNGKMSAINLNYCAQCKQIDTERVSNCRWLNFNFCHLKCLQLFIDRLECDICKRKFHNNCTEQLNYNRIHLRDDVKNLVTFVCDECFVQRTPLAIKCYFCADKCYEGFGTWDLKTTGLISKYVCSEQCRILALTTNGHKTELVSCSECHGQEKNCTRIMQNGIVQSIRCPKCLERAVNEQKIKFGLLFVLFTV